jgi:hypothetical protein
MLGKARVVLPTSEALFLGGGYKHTVFEERGGGVMEVAADA